MKAFKNLLFDFGGVILDLNPSASIRAFRELGVPEGVLSENFWTEGIFAGIDRGTVSQEEFCEEMRRMGQIPNRSDEEIIKAWNVFITGVKPRALEALKSLSEKYPLYMLSNVSIMHWNYTKPMMRYQGEDAFIWFQKCFASYQMHLEKPELEIYQEVIRKAGIEPSETLFIDDRQDNLDGAAKAGFQTMITENGDWIEKLISCK